MAGILPMYCEIVVNATYKINICIGSKVKRKGNKIKRQAKLPMPGMKPLTKPADIPTKVGTIRSSIFDNRGKRYCVLRGVSKIP